MASPELNLQPYELQLTLRKIIESSLVTWITRSELKWLIYCLQMTRHDAKKGL